MNNRLLKISFLTLILMTGLGFTVFPIQGQATPKISVTPMDNIFSTETTSVGDSFTVDIVTSGWEDPGLFAHEFKLYYNTTLLDVVEAAYPAGHFLPAPNFEVPVDINEESGYILFGVTKLGDVPGSTGAGTLSTVTFEITTAPPAAKSVSCDLRLDDIVFLDPDGDSVEIFDVEHGYYEFAAPRPPLPYLKVLPETSRADAIGQHVFIDITIQELAADWKAVAFEWKLTYDPTILGFLNATEGEWLAQFGDTFFHAIQEEDYLISFTLELPPWVEPWPEGSGTLATMEFNATNAGACDLTLSGVVILDVDGNELETRPHESGVYAFAPPYLSVEPKTATLENIGEAFSLHVIMNDLDKTWKMVGIEFKLYYNTTLLETSEEMIMEGEFLKDFAQHAGTDTWFQAYVEEDHGLIGILILPLTNGTWPEDVFPEGTGVLASLTFTAIWQHETEDVSDWLVVDDPLLVDIAAKTIPVDLELTAAEGTCLYTISKAYVPPPPPPIPPAERLVDLYTQYDAPYGGQGANVPSDAFAPQGQVKLYAKVLYRGQGVPDKPVAYHVRGPKGYEFIATTFADSNGIAVLDSGIPTSEMYFGVWEVTASVDIAGQVVSDDLIFRVGWPVSVEKTDVETELEPTLGLPTLEKGETYSINSTLKVITMQPPEKCVTLEGMIPKTLLVYSGFDELTQPIFSQYIPISIDYGPETLGDLRGEYDLTAEIIAEMERFVRDPSGRPFYSPETSITIPTSAFTGVANIAGAVFTDFPWAGGVPYTSAHTENVWIGKLAPEPGAPPEPTGILSVSSVTVTVPPVTKYKIFDVYVKIREVDPDAHAVGIEFTLTGCGNLLECIEVIEGDFVKQFGPTTFVGICDTDQDAIVGVVQLPPYPGENGWMREGGTVARIRFKTLTDSYGEPITGSCMLTLTSAYLVGHNAADPTEPLDIEFQRLEHGIVRVIF